MSDVRQVDNDFNLTDTELLILHEWWMKAGGPGGADAALMLRLDEERGRRTRTRGMDEESRARALETGKQMRRR